MTFYKITKITDPFGRSATFCYNSGCDTNGAVGSLQSITDTIGLTSQFTYSSNDFISAMTTPYGTTTFTYNETTGIGQGANQYYRYLDATDPLGLTERTEFETATPVPCTSDPDDCTIPTNMVPAGFSGSNQYMNYRNTFFWDKNAMQQYPGDYTKARVIHWLHDFSNNGENVTSGFIESEMKPLENPVWYLYWNQTDPLYINTNMLASPAQVARVLDDGTTQLYQYKRGG